MRELLQLSQEPISLETPVGEEEDAHLEDFIQDEEAGVPVDEAGRQLLRQELMNVLKSLTPREERVLTLRFGLDDGQPRTLEELGREFNVTRERIRQIEAKALRKLRHPQPRQTAEGLSGIRTMQKHPAGRGCFCFAENKSQPVQNAQGCFR